MIKSMDKRLKQRLLGVAVLVALAVIIVPELVKEPETRLSPVVDNNVVPQMEVSSQGTTTTYSLPGPVQQQLAATQGSAETPGDSSVAVAPTPEEVIPDIEFATILPPAEQSIVEPEPVKNEWIEVKPAPVVEPPSAAVLEPPPTAVPPIGVRPESEPEPKVAEPEPEPEPEPKVAEPEPAPLPQKPEPERTPPPASRAESAPKPPPQPKPKQPEPRVVTKPAAPTGDSGLPPITLISRAGGETAIPPKASARTAASGQRWMVQAGSFKVAQNAEFLRDELRGRGYDARVEQAVVDQRTLYRVRVGPQISRGESAKVRDRLQRDTGIKGVVVAR